MNRTYAFAGIAILAAAAGTFAIIGARDIVGADVRLALFDTGSTTRGILYVPIVADAERTHVRISLGEQEIGSTSIPVQEASRVGIPVALSGDVQPGSVVRISLNGEEIERTISEIVREERDLLELQSVTKPEEAMKFGIKTVFAKEPVTEAGRITPDIAQDPAECAPTSAANSIISLAEEHGMEDKLPPDAQLID